MIATLAMTAAGTLASRASAQERPLRIIFPFGAGGAADAVLRHLAEAREARVPAAVMARVAIRNRRRAISTMCDLPEAGRRPSIGLSRQDRLG